ncbi:class I adenylate-forming enzyme family protein [Phaeovulum sp.]|uniref:class I adenylate-forming enzyme family protein n=1 Tax=Phaeovulum sp. TaxID=2934796 RepID=UPI002730BB30|nr:fatty acid--CoA ligase family protein [Phaeovulum sp.]MDP1670277.1 fatty acid--CoA ligase family protein [Phaeovulum sp.]MDZ4118041.1 fatty acid--CoA ligase family protein [Phaeovulum sp.]
MTALLQSANLGAAFARTAMAQPGRQAIVAEDMALDYARLWLIVQGFALRMQAAGIDQRAIVALKSTDMIASIAVMFATTLLGAGFVIWEDQLLADGVVRPTHVLRSPEVAAPGGVASILMEASWSPKHTPVPENACEHFPGAADTEAAWWYLHTSGTTGRPKYLALSQRVALDRSLALGSDFLGAETRFTSLFPCTTRPFFVRAMAALVHGATIIDTIDPAFMQAQGVTLVCGSPRQTEAWLQGRRLSPRLMLLQLSGARFTAAQAEVLLGSFQKVEDVYGSSETNKAFVNVKTLDDGTLVTRASPQDSSVEILRPDGAPCASGEIGEVRIRNSYMVPGYINALEATRRAFRDGWFHPGDLACWDQQAALCIVGRVDEIINLGGMKIDPLEVEQALRVPGVRASACFRDPRGELRLLAFVEIEASRDPEPVVRQAMAQCAQKLGPLMTPALVYVVERIPMTHDGVPMRAQCEVMAKDLPSEAL